MKKERFMTKILGIALGCVMLVATFGVVLPHPVQSDSSDLIVNIAQTYQTIDGMGVNINVNSWDDGLLKPALDSLIINNGSSIFRVNRDPTDWVSSESLIPALHDLNPETLQQVYETPKMQDIWNTIGYLNENGIGGEKIVLAFQGWLPVWLQGNYNSLFYRSCLYVTPCHFHFAKSLRRPD